MPVTFTVASHRAKEWWRPKYPTPEAVLAGACEAQYQNCKRIIRSSLRNEDLPDRIAPLTNGFVHAVLEAWASHMHLRIRPDDVWVAILNQFNFYVNAHAEELRRYFVAHDGRKGLNVKDNTMDFAVLARKMSQKIHENVVDSTLVEWILPDFTTTTLHDRAVCSVIMMATLKQYFSYSMGDTCGIPSVTLEGERSDWENIYARLDRLYELGDQPSVWAEMLRPILRRFILAFDGYPDVTFWDHVAHRTSEYCGQDDLSGWLTAFCVWDNKGRWQPHSMPSVIPTRPLQSVVPKEHDVTVSPKSAAGTSPPPEKTGWSKIAGRIPGLRKTRKGHEGVQQTTVPGPQVEDYGSGSMMKHGSSGNSLYTLDDVSYFMIPVGYVPAGYCEVDVTLIGDIDIHCTMIAGHFAAAISESKPGGRLDTISPSPHWVIFEKKLHSG
ncbi:hypothetical protein L227DRAFT_610364 [Lentinus tigrinus ALCF2SS1-6]|uniref:Uncharacterized protein n=1 Tax=Lentinus tigrinus ALCF2SS1-6 TaxID=1328759 RepID=A0A5C2SC52_9APHY|nr:hypothetical protein L227DRAFT_610364 [Lentinus tigrinus ALCF2SS1-6]